MGTLRKLRWPVCVVLLVASMILIVYGNHDTELWAAVMFAFGWALARGK